MIEFKGVHYPKSVILHAVFTLPRLRRFLPRPGGDPSRAWGEGRPCHAEPLGGKVRSADRSSGASEDGRTAPSWRMDETYLKVKGRWTYLYRAVDRDGQTLDFMLSERRDLLAARSFFELTPSSGPG